MVAKEFDSKFELVLRRTALLSVLLDDPAIPEFIPTLSELDTCGFSVTEPELDMEYQIRIGDETPDDSLGSDWGPMIIWKQISYFESARGRVLVQLLSRNKSSITEWRRRAQFFVNVLPGKLGEDRYEAMFEDLRAVSVGLVFDLLSKSRLQLGLTGIGQLSSRPASAELAVLERLWASVSATLLQIALQPMVGLHQTRERRLSWGSERFSEAGLRQLSSAGIDPRKKNAPRPFFAIRERLCETFNISEHRTILGFLWFLRDRVIDCAQRAEQHVLAIQKERQFRDINQGDGSNLFRDIDMPKLQRLKIASGRAKELAERIRSAEQLEFLRGLAGELRAPNGPIFSNVLPYRRFRDDMLQYLGTSLAILDEGVEERTKSTGHMYEQWVFLQVLAALRQCGLSPLSQDGLLTRAQRHRFTVDIERGTRVSFRCLDGRTLVVRYEPWIHPAPLARSRYDTVYRGISGENSWCPDILIEVLTESNRHEQARLDYAVAIDAKYTKRISQQHQDGVRKYNEIRSTADDRPVVMQVWLAYPGEDGITPWDEAVEWTALGPSRPKGEVVNGTLGVMPPSTPNTGECSAQANEVILDFMIGLLSYLNIVMNHDLASKSRQPS